MANKTKFQAIKGTRDLLPPETELWNRVEQTVREVFGSFGFGEIRLPIFEPTELFARAVGGETDIVSKEMYTFEDYEASPVLDLRNTLVTWEEPHSMQGPPGPLGTGSLARFQPFAGLLSRFCLTALTHINLRRKNCRLATNSVANVAFWHIASFRCAAKFGRYGRHSGLCSPSSCTFYQFTP